MARSESQPGDVAEAQIVPFHPKAQGREVELKFDVDISAVEDLRAALLALGGKGKTATLKAVYHDTPDETLRRLGFALRVRDEGGRKVQTIKADDGLGLFDRSEWETPVKSSAPDLVAARLTPLAVVLNRCGPLQPAFATDIQRQSLVVRRSGGQIEIALDVGEIEADGRRIAVRQLELELKAGDPDALFALAAELSAKHPLRLTFETKSAIGYRLKSGKPLAALGKASAEVISDMTAGEGFAAVAGACLRQVVHNGRVAAEHRRPEAVHQMRVGLRRLRAAIKLFAPILGDTNALTLELKWMAGQLNPARDTDVFIAETFRPGTAVLGDTPGMAAFGRHLLQAQTRAYDDMVAALNSPRGRALGLTVAQWIEAGDWRTAHDGPAAAARYEPLPLQAAAALERLHQRIRRDGKGLARLPADARHKIRLKAKALRYGLEFFGGLYRQKSVKRLSADLAGLQDHLGALNDVAFAQEAARAYLRPKDPAELGFAAGRVVGLRAHDEAALIKSAVRARKAVLAHDPPWRE